MSTTTNNNAIKKRVTTQQIVRQIRIRCPEACEGISDSELAHRIDTSDLMREHGRNHGRWDQPVYDVSKELADQWIATTFGTPSDPAYAAAQREMNAKKIEANRHFYKDLSPLAVNPIKPEQLLFLAEEHGKTLTEIKEAVAHVAARLEKRTKLRESIESRKVVNELTAERDKTIRFRDEQIKEIQDAWAAEIKELNEAISENSPHLNDSMLRSDLVRSCRNPEAITDQEKWFSRY